MGPTTSSLECFENLQSLLILSILINYSLVKLQKKFLHLNGIEMYILSKNSY